MNNKQPHAHRSDAPNHAAEHRRALAESVYRAVCDAHSHNARGTRKRLDDAVHDYISAMPFDPVIYFRAHEMASVVSDRLRGLSEGDRSTAERNAVRMRALRALQTLLGSIDARELPTSADIAATLHTLTPELEKAVEAERRAVA